MDDSDRRLSERVRSWTPPRWFRLWMVGATRFGDGPGVGGHGRGPRRGRFPRARGGRRRHGAALLASGVFLALKRRFRRPRPCDMAPTRSFDVSPPDPFSFPSGHSMNAFAIGTVLALSFPPLLPALAFLAASIAASRVVLGMHYVSDVGAGAALGVLIGACAFAAL